MNLAHQALDIYRTGYESAKDEGDVGQILYNGINVAYLSLELDKPYTDLAEELLAVAETRDEPDYWTHATRGEALLLLERYQEASEAYQEAMSRTVTPRYLATTAVQARNILNFRGSPPEAQPVMDFIGSLTSLDFDEYARLAEEQQADEEFE